MHAGGATANKAFRGAAYFLQVNARTVWPISWRFYKSSSTNQCAIPLYAARATDIGKYTIDKIVHVLN
jgi:hypothetical protein